MFFYTKQNTSQIIHENMELNTRYNLDMMSYNRNKIINKNNYNQQYEKMVIINENKKNQDNRKRQEKIKSLKILEPKMNKWNEDIFEQMKLDEQKRKMKELKLIEPKISGTNFISYWDEELHDWIEKYNNICV